MRTSDRTLIDRLINDEDRRDSLHDLACQFIARTDAAEKLRVLAFGTPLYKEMDHHNDSYRGRHTFQRRAIGHEIEMPIMAKNNFVIGFADVMLKFACKHVFAGEMRTAKGWEGGNQLYEWVPCPANIESWRATDGIENRFDLLDGEPILIEVKVRVPPIGDLLRQMKLYKSHITPSETRVRMVVVTCAQIDSNYKRELSAEKIGHAYLSPERVRSWHDTTKAQSKSLEL